MTKADLNTIEFKSGGARVSDLHLAYIYIIYKFEIKNIILYDAFYVTNIYLKGSNFRGQKFSRNKFSRLAGPKTVSFAELIFAIGLFIGNFWEFIFAMDRSKRS